jgi:transposase
MVGRHELTDAAWTRIEPLLPATGARGGRWRDHRLVMNAILWRRDTGDGPLRFVYAFATDSIDDVVYRFSGDR